ncbi:MAG TPA: sigma-70 family RNA polymerase sigma factor [Anaerolineae bacterium]|nr:sigma-70 family RNA polymerase sigma factor [Anaerolineae bacterium]
MLDSDETNLILAAKQGDAQAIGHLYDRYHQQIFRFVWSRVGNQQLAEDITGEVFVRMVQYLPKYNLNGKPFHAWLYKISRNLITDMYRHRSNHSIQPLTTTQHLDTQKDTLDNIVNQKLTLETVHEALDCIDPKQKEALQLRFLADLSLKESAELMDCSVGALKSLQHRGLKALRAALHATKLGLKEIDVV